MNKGVFGEDQDHVLATCMFGENTFPIYRPQRSCGKVKFSQASVILFTGGGGHALQGAGMAGDMHSGGMCGRGACIARGCAWWGVCMAGGMCGGGHAW